MDASGENGFAALDGNPVDGWCGGLAVGVRPEDEASRRRVEGHAAFRLRELKRARGSAHGESALNCDVLTEVAGKAGGDGCGERGRVKRARL